LKSHKPSDAYAILGLTNEDLYSGDNWHFVFGWASYTTGVGTFSFKRYDPSFDGTEDEHDNPEQALLMYACHVMAHEIGHMFGLYHCIYYECLMNGINSAYEQRRTLRTFCPVCLKKLKRNLNFDVRKRYENLIKVCKELGFDEEAKVY